MEGSQGKREGEGETERERDREVMADTEEEHEGERAGRKARFSVSGLGTPGDKNGPSALVLCSLVLTDVLGTYRCTHVGTCMHIRYMCPHRCDIVYTSLCLPVHVSAQTGLREHVC